MQHAKLHVFHPSKMADKASKENVMKQIYVEKLVVNCCVGGENDQLTKATKVLEQLTG